MFVCIDHVKINAVIFNHESKRLYISLSSAKILTMEKLKRRNNRNELPVRIMQFGTGNFLRGFADAMIDEANERTGWDAGVILVKNTPKGDLNIFRSQDSVFTVILRGIENGKAVTKTRYVSCVQDSVNPYNEYGRFLSFAALPSLRFVISNTTEAGIRFNESDAFDSEPPLTFPGTLTRLLLERFTVFDGSPDAGLIMLPTELNDDNGEKLKDCVNNYIRLWELPEEFASWIDTCCVFTSTMVDRIITGFPREEAEAHWKELGNRDELLVCGELSASWIIESPVDFSNEFPLAEAGLPVVFTDTLKPYKTRKVRILNGLHTGMVHTSFLAGNDTVLDTMNDGLTCSFIEAMLRSEIIPSLPPGISDAVRFAEATLERFRNPYIRHNLLSISLNSVAKWDARCLPSLQSYVEKFGRIPSRIAFSLAALICFYSPERSRGGETYAIQDTPEVIRFFDEEKGNDIAHTVQSFLSNTHFHDSDLSSIPGLADTVSAYARLIRTAGMRAAIKELENEN